MTLIHKISTLIVSISFGVIGGTTEHSVIIGFLCFFSVFSWVILLHLTSETY